MATGQCGMGADEKCGAAGDRVRLVAWPLQLSDGVERIASRRIAMEGDPFFTGRGLCMDEGVD